MEKVRVNNIHLYDLNRLIVGSCGGVRVRLHTAINRADFRSGCMLYTYEGNKMHS